jgi:hypothetical protein
MYNQKRNNRLLSERRKQQLLEEISQEVYLRIICEQYGIDRSQLDEAGRWDAVKGLGLAAGMTLAGLGGVKGQAVQPPTAGTEIAFKKGDQAATVASYGTLGKEFKKKTGYPMAGPAGTGGIAKLIKAQLPDALAGSNETFEVLLKVVQALNKTSSVKATEFQIPSQIEVPMSGQQNKAMLIVDVAQGDTILITNKAFYAAPANSTSAFNTIKKMQNANVSTDFKDRVKNLTAGGVQAMPSHVRGYVDGKVKTFLANELLKLVGEVTGKRVIPINTQTGRIENPSQLPKYLKENNRLQELIDQINQGNDMDAYFAYDNQGNFYYTKGEAGDKATTLRKSSGQVFSREEVLDMLTALLSRGLEEQMEELNGKKLTDSTGWFYYIYQYVNGTNSHTAYDPRATAEYFLANGVINPNVYN